MKYDQSAPIGKCLKGNDAPLGKCVKQDQSAPMEKVVKEDDPPTANAKREDTAPFEQMKHEANAPAANDILKECDVSAAKHVQQAHCLPVEKVAQEDDSPAVKHVEQKGGAPSHFYLAASDEFPNLSAMTPKKGKTWTRATVEQPKAAVSVAELTTSPSCSDFSSAESPASTAEDGPSIEQEGSETSSLFAVNLGYGAEKDLLLVKVANVDRRSSSEVVYSQAELIAHRNLVQDAAAMIRWTTAERKDIARSPKRRRSDTNISPHTKTHSDNWRRHSQPSSVDDFPSLTRSDSAWSDHRESLHPHGAADEEEAKTAKKMKGILNKLSNGNFEILVVQLMDIGLTTEFRINALCSEIFEKATTQHGFIDLYARLCMHLDKTKVRATEGSTFRSVLLASCQAHFVKCLLPPEGMLDNKIEDADAFERELKYKNAMLGNIKFVGTLLCQKLVASKVLIGMAYELLETRTAVSIESLCVLLTRCGASFDNDGWMYHTSLQFLFDALKDVAKKDKTIGNRIKFLIQDVLDLRRRKWVA
eukprot:GEMP01017985.1.p1 GENE.GEMP01017985.1~~GEMP01017985.1.p1  ORF type:complete len:558 (+),score=115.02 GEMP01017985.1:76-1674(+)